MNKKIILFFPLLIAVFLCELLFLGLKNDPKNIDSALVGKSVPEFDQTSLLQPWKVISNQDLPKQYFLINVWGTWCHYCLKEHRFLLELNKQGIQIIGVNYRDKLQSAVQMLENLGNPFVLTINDSEGKLAMKLGVNGTPETYLVDSNHIIRYRYSGELTPQIWQQKFIPKIEKLTD
ncbi:DsbE family thiol:disulfide interchange protein [Seminibacterium arietis]|uniref:DsbE family thiol:disulfide interchange protein n=1 Tax=Seminibacterium arietis TaxID=1173502 RepID=A0ABW3I9A1_9PAST